MSRQLVDEMKMQELQFKIAGVESDQIADFCFFIGDLNYRLKTSFTDLNNSNVSEKAIAMLPSHDQLIEAISEGHFPDYEEQRIDYLPTYKMSTSEEVYVNKNDQAPSYCDRCLFKNNMPLQWSADFYRCLH